MNKKTKNVQKTEELLEEALVPEEVQPYKIPDNWLWTNLNSIAEWGSGGTPKSGIKEYYDGNLPWLIIADLNDNIVNSSRRTITELGIKNSSAKLVPIGSVLVAMYGSIGKLGLAGIECTTNQAIAFTKEIRPTTFNKFLFYYLKSIRTELISLGKGGTQQNISQAVLKEVPFPLPPLSEQRRIADKVERLLNNIDEAKQLIKEAKKRFEIRRAAILDKAFRGELTARWRRENKDRLSTFNLKDLPKDSDDKMLNQLPEINIPGSWRWVISKELFSLVTSGSRGWAKYYSDNGDLFIRVGNLSYDSIEIDLSSEQRVNPPEGSEGVRTLVQEGDILVSITADVGRIAVVPNNFPKAYINQHVALARPNQNFCIEYLAWFLASRNGGRLQFARLQRGATKAGLGLNDIKSVWVPFPLLEEQYEVVRTIKRTFEKLNTVESQLDNTLKSCEQLKNSILFKAFRGELGTNIPTEENAIELLKEVLQEQIK